MSNVPERYPTASPQFKPTTADEHLRWAAVGVVTEARVLQLTPYGDFKLVGTYYDVSDSQSSEDTLLEHLHYVYFRKPEFPSFNIPGDEVFAGFIHVGPTCLAVLMRAVLNTAPQPAPTKLAVRIEPIDPDNGVMSIPGNAKFFGGVEINGQLYAVFTSNF